MQPPSTTRTRHLPTETTRAPSQRTLWVGALVGGGRLLGALRCWWGDRVVAAALLVHAPAQRGPAQVDGGRPGLCCLHLLALALHLGRRLLRAAQRGLAQVRAQQVHPGRRHLAGLAGPAARRLAVAHPVQQAVWQRGGRRVAPCRLRRRALQAPLPRKAQALRQQALHGAARKGPKVELHALRHLQQPARQQHQLAGAPCRARRQAAL